MPNIFVEMEIVQIQTWNLHFHVLWASSWKLLNHEKRWAKVEMYENPIRKGAKREELIGILDSMLMVRSDYCCCILTAVIKGKKWSQVMTQFTA